MTKERPILFSAPMVRALLDGSKTQTRRAWREQPPDGVRIGWVPGQSTTPYGKEGDRLWVREAWRTVREANDMPPRDTNGANRFWYEANAQEDHHAHQLGYGKLRPSIHMPRWASRITLEVTGVRVERLQDISEADAIAEGIERSGECNWRHYGDDGDDFTQARRSYRSLWEVINGPSSWAANPWVWVVEFRRL